HTPVPRPLVSAGHAESPKRNRRHTFPPPTADPPSVHPRVLTGRRPDPASDETRNCTGRIPPQRSAQARSSAQLARCGRAQRESITVACRSFLAWGFTPPRPEGALHPPP